MDDAGPSWQIEHLTVVERRGLEHRRDSRGACPQYVQSVVQHPVPPQRHLRDPTLAQRRGEVVGVHEDSDAFVLAQEFGVAFVVVVAVGEHDRFDGRHRRLPRGKEGGELAPIAGQAGVDEDVCAGIFHHIEADERSAKPSDTRDDLSGPRLPEPHQAMIGPDAGSDTVVDRQPMVNASAAQLTVAPAGRSAVPPITAGDPAVSGSPLFALLLRPPGQRRRRFRARVIRFAAMVMAWSIRLPRAGRMPAWTAKAIPS